MKDLIFLDAMHGWSGGNRRIFIHIGHGVSKAWCYDENQIYEALMIFRRTLPKSEDFDIEDVVEVLNVDSDWVHATVSKLRPLVNQVKGFINETSQKSKSCYAVSSEVSNS